MFTLEITRFFDGVPARPYTLIASDAADGARYLDCVAANGSFVVVIRCRGRVIARESVNVH